MEFRPVPVKHNALFLKYLGQYQLQQCEIKTRLFEIPLFLNSENRKISGTSLSCYETLALWVIRNK